MLRFLLGFIAIIFLSIVVYLAIGSDSQQDKNLNVEKVRKAEVTSVKTEVAPVNKITEIQSDVKVQSIKKEVPLKKLPESIASELTEDEFSADVEKMTEGEIEEDDSNLESISDDKLLDDSELDAIEKQMRERGEISDEITGDSQNNLGYDPSELAFGKNKE